MSKVKSRHNTKMKTPGEAVSPSQRTERWTSFCLGAMTSLLVSTPLIPTDSLPHPDLGIPLVMLWLTLLVVWALTAVLEGRVAIRFSWTTVAVMALIAVHALSAMIMIREGAGNGRAALNVLWRWTSFGVAFFLVRQLALTPVHCRALCSVMIAVAVGLSTYGVFQYFIVFPQRQAAYQQATETEKQAMLDRAMLPYYRPGTPERRHFDDRMASVEPTATFALANSLAGFLAPWLTAAMAVGMVAWSDSTLRQRILVGCVCGVMMIGFCLLLTKSRAAFLSVAVGVAILGTCSWRLGQHFCWKIPLFGGVAFVALLAIAVLAGGVDIKVLSEGAKSLTYRFEYWQATWGMIGDYPWLGCGPGNFKPNYTLYKLPQASETVNDPHNFLLEIWSTTGTLGMLALMAIMGSASMQIWRACHQVPTTQEAQQPAPGRAAGKNSAQTIYLGTAAGLLVAFGNGLVVGSLPDVAILLVATPATIGLLWLLHPWVTHGKITAVMVLVPSLVLLINLTVAGGISYAGVALSCWLLLAITLNVTVCDRDLVRVPRAAVFVLLLLGTALVAAYQQTVVLPVYSAANLLVDGSAHLKSGEIGAAELAFLEAAKADVYGTDGWRGLAWISLERWKNGRPRSEAEFNRFEQAVLEYERRDSKSYLMYHEIGNWYLTAYRTDGRAAQLDKALRYFRAAADRYPASNILHAQVAWVHHLLGNVRAAADAADKAMALDALNPHRELKLENQRIFDGFEEPLQANAEQLMIQLRRRKHVSS